MYDNSQQG